MIEQSTLEFEDLNQMIRIFSYAIQQRIDELSSIEVKPIIKLENEMKLIMKYENCKIKEQKEVQCINKFCQRIIQVFSYFKNRSTHKNLLSLLEEKLISSIDGIVMKIPIVLGQLLKVIIIFVKTPFQTQNKSNNIELSMSSIKLKINPYEKSKAKIPYVTPFNVLTPSNQSRCITTNQSNKGQQSYDSKRLKTSLSGIYIRRHTSDTRQSLTKKRPYTYYLNLDLDQRFIISKQKAQKQLLKRNENIKNDIDSYYKQFQKHFANQQLLLTDITKRSSNINKKVLPNRRNRPYTSMKQQQQDITCSLFRQRKYRKAHQQNICPIGIKQN